MDRTATAVPLRAHNGRVHPPTESAAFRAPGFGFVRWFLKLMILTIALLIAAVGLLSTHLSMDVTVAATGAVEPQTRREVKTSVGGLIKRVHVAQGQRVTAGDLLITLADDEWQRDLNRIGQELAINQSRILEIQSQMQKERDLIQTEQARAHADQAMARLQYEQMHREYALYYASYPPIETRTRPSIEDLLPIRLRRAAVQRTEAEMDRLTARLKAVESREQEIQTLEAARKKLIHERQWLMQQQARTVIRAPISGVVLTEDLNRRLGDRLQPGDAVIELAKLDDWQAKVWVPEADIARVNRAQPARIYVHAFPHMEYQIFAGTVISVADQPKISEQTGLMGAVYPVKIKMQNTRISDGEHDYHLACGMGVEAKIVIDHGAILTLLKKKLLRTMGRLNQNDLHLSAAAESETP